MSVLNEYIENGFLRVGATQSLGDGGGGGRQRLRGDNTLKFQAMPPEVGTSKSADYTPVSVLGRANPLFIYGSSGERSWNLELKFFATETGIQVPEEETQANSQARVNAINDSVRRQVADKINWCEALVYPIYKNNLSQGTATVQFVFGDMINVNCICTNVQSSYPGPFYIKSKSQLGWPLFGIANLTLTQIGGGSISYQDVRDNLHQSPRMS